MSILTPDWQEEAREFRRARDNARSPLERIALDNTWSEAVPGIPMGILLLALEKEERDALLDAVLAEQKEHHLP